MSLLQKTQRERLHLQMSMAMVRLTWSSHCATMGVLMRPMRAQDEETPIAVARTSAG